MFSSMYFFVRDEHWNLYIHIEYLMLFCNQKEKIFSSALKSTRCLRILFRILLIFKHTVYVYFF